MTRAARTEALSATLARRAVTVPAVTALAVVSPALVVATAVVTGPVSLCLRRHLRTVRLACFLVTYLSVELLALACALWIWVRSGLPSRRDTVRYQDANFRLIEKSLARLYSAARRLFRLRVEVRTGDPGAGKAPPGTSPGPVIVLSRHAGPGDSFLLVYGLLAYARLRPFIVLKQALALDPWIDVLIGRVPHCFVPTGRGDGDRTARKIGELAERLGDRDALVLFPEGGNFTPDRRRRAIRHLRRRGQRKRAAQAARLEQVLPPRPDGVLAAVGAAPSADLAFVAHTGLDHMDSAGAVWRGVPLERPLLAAWWRVRAENVPAGAGERADVLFAQWARVDAWIKAHRTMSEQTAGQQTAGKRARARQATHQGVGGGPVSRLASVIEFMRFRLAPGADETEFLAADRRLQEDFAYQQPGLLRRTTARGLDGGWIVIDLWRSAADADACAARWDSDPAAQGFMALVDRSSVTTERYMPLD